MPLSTRWPASAICSAVSFGHFAYLPAALGQRDPLHLALPDRLPLQLRNAAKIVIIGRPSFVVTLSCGVSPNIGKRALLLKVIALSLDKMLS